MLFEMKKKLFVDFASLDLKRKGKGCEDLDMVPIVAKKRKNVKKAAAKDKKITVKKQIKKDTPPQIPNGSDGGSDSQATNKFVCQICGVAYEKYT